MAADMESTPEKKRKLNEYESNNSNNPPVLSDFKGFSVQKVLSQNVMQKRVTVHAKLGEDDAVVMLEKIPFDKAHMERCLTSGTSLKNTLKNDIYGTYEAYPPPVENAIKAMVIHPATEKHIAKYTDHERYVVEETAELYNSVTLPHLLEQQFSVQWVYNILEKKQESERIVFEDEDPETGFILLPDMKWDRKDVNSLYLVAIVKKHGLKSLRDLDADCLPLLKNIKDKGLSKEVFEDVLVSSAPDKKGLQKAIEEGFHVPRSKLQVYIHYQPSYYHLHIHFTNINMEAPGFGADRAHLLQDVIENIELCSDYYKKTSLTFVVRENDKLYSKLKDHGYFDS